MESISWIDLDPVDSHFFFCMNRHFDDSQLGVAADSNRVHSTGHFAFSASH